MIFRHRVWWLILLSLWKLNIAVLGRRALPLLVHEALCGPMFCIISKICTSPKKSNGLVVSSSGRLAIQMTQTLAIFALPKIFYI
jgi:hypothetical protein